MSVFKSLNRSDVFLTDYVSKKKWILPGNNLESLGVSCSKAYSGSSPILNIPYEEGDLYSRLLYRNLYQSYYSGSVYNEEQDSDGNVIKVTVGAFTGSADLEIQSSVTSEGMRQFPGATDIYHPLDKTPFVAVFTIPRDVVGTHIEVGTIEIYPVPDAINYVKGDPKIPTESSERITDRSGYVEYDDTLKDPYYFENQEIGVSTDIEGNLIGSGFTGEFGIPEGFEYPTPIQSKGKVIGDVIYNRGLIIVTDPFWAWVYGNFKCDQINWVSNVPIYTYNINCKVQDFEFNSTYNKTAIDSGLNGTKDFTPYISSVGLYNNRNELVAIAKLSQPIKKEDNIDMSFNIRVDIS